MSTSFCFYRTVWAGTVQEIVIWTYLYEKTHYLERSFSYSSSVPGTGSVCFFVQKHVNKLERILRKMLLIVHWYGTVQKCLLTVFCSVLR